MGARPRAVRTQPTHSKTLSTVSPSLLELLNACPLRVAWGQAGHGPAPVPAGPALRGVAAHRALELHLGQKATSVGEAWEMACDEIAIGGEDPRDVPGSSRTKLRLTSRVSELERFIHEIAPHEMYLERELISRDLLIRGKPDLLMVNDSVTVVDYKSGMIAEGDIVSDGYRRQVLLYATLAGETLSRPVGAAALFSLRQGLVVLDTSEEQRIDVWDSALEALRAFNARVPGEQPPTPSNDGCRWCPYSCRCVPAWSALKADAIHDLGGGAAVAGRLEASPSRAANGMSAIFVRPSVGGGEGHQAAVVDVPTNLVTHMDQGSTLAIVGLGVRSEEPLVLYWVEGRSRLEEVAWPGDVSLFN